MKASLNLIQTSRSGSGILIALAIACYALLPRAQAAPEAALPGFNTADGQNALANVTTGAANSAFGWSSLLSDTDGSFNTGLGAGALLSNNATGSTAVGAASLLFNTGSFNTGVGVKAGIDNTTGSNNIYVGDVGFEGESNVISIGQFGPSGTPYDSFFAGGIFGANVDAATAVTVYVDKFGKLGTTPLDSNGNKMRVPLRNGAKPQAMLNELRKAQDRITELESAVARLAATVKEQAAQIQKVGAQVELKKPTRRTVANK